MAYDIVQLNDDIYHLQSGANCGLILHEGRAVLIDAGLDDDAGRQIKRALNYLKVELAAIILTHGHADHFGGTSYLHRNLPPFSVYATPYEGVYAHHSSLEGFMLFGGAIPFDQLQGKFTLAPATNIDRELGNGEIEISGITVDILPLPGHAPAQIGVRHGDVLFTGDAFLPSATLKKYPIPYTAHIGQALDTLRLLDSLVVQGFILAPGHGTHVAAGQAQEALQANIAALETVIATVESLIAVEPLDEAQITQRAAAQLGDPLATAVGYYLARATIQAALVYLYENKRATPISGGKLVWKS
ncbi:MAG: MBL fold metallo-hydrolase [Anaerolineae bacterium]|nr:MBL fold metallo-hydrolase [Anaerolineae bacterium]